MTEPFSDMQDVSRDALQEAIPGRLAKETPNYLAEYGMRYDDGVLVFQFFPARNSEGWDAAYQMDKRLERAIPEIFDTRKVSADYVHEVSSFCVRVNGMSQAPDPLAAAALFFESIEASL